MPQSLNGEWNYSYLPIGEFLYHIVHHKDPHYKARNSVRDLATQPRLPEGVLFYTRYVPAVVTADQKSTGDRNIVMMVRFVYLDERDGGIHTYKVRCVGDEHYKWTAEMRE
jgi:hypothetical protein